MVIVTAALIRRDGQVLLTRRAPGQPMAGRWEFPGGTVEPGETPAQCLGRELREELGIEAAIGEQVASTDHVYPRGPIRLLLFAVPSFSGSITLNVHDKLAWVEPADLLSYDLAPADVPLARSLIP